MEEARVVVDAGPQVLVEQEPLGGRGEDPAGVGRAPLHPDVLHVGVLCPATADLHCPVSPPGRGSHPLASSPES